MNEQRYHAIRQYLGVYVVTDERKDHDETIKILEKAILGGATAIQLRCKQTLGREFVNLAKRVRMLTSKHGVLFFVNDRVDVAAIVDADGVHVGQDDIHVKDARKILGDKWIGVSADTIDDAVAAEADGADYIGVGAVYPTKSKADAGFTGLPGLREVCNAVTIPVVGIGGITIENAHAVFEQGAVGVAVVSAVMQAKDPQTAAEALKDILRVKVNLD